MSLMYVWIELIMHWLSSLGCVCVLCMLPVWCDPWPAPEGALQAQRFACGLRKRITPQMLDSTAASLGALVDGSGATASHPGHIRGFIPRPVPQQEPILSHGSVRDVFCVVFVVQVLCRCTPVSLARSSKRVLMFAASVPHQSLTVQALEKIGFLAPA